MWPDDLQRILPAALKGSNPFIPPPTPFFSAKPQQLIQQTLLSLSDNCEDIDSDSSFDNDGSFSNENKFDHHKIISTIMKRHFTRESPKTKYYRNCSKFDVDYFSSELSHQLDSI